MSVYKAKAEKIRGTSFREIHKKAMRFYQSIIQNSRRRPYVRSAYFKGEKIFLSLFWSHLQDKNWRDRKRRLIYLPLAIELMKNSKFKPESKENPNKNMEIFHRFIGLDKNGMQFFVQIKENLTSGKKWFISSYPYE